MSLSLGSRHARMRTAFLVAIAVGALSMAIDPTFALVFFKKVNVATSYPTYGPYAAQLWGENTSTKTTSQRVEAQINNIYWSDVNAANVRRDVTNIAPTFHAFVYQQNNPSGQCAAPFSYNGYSASSETNYWVYTKNANTGTSCPYGGNYQNEVRIYWPGSNVVSTRGFYGIASFTIANGNLYLPGTGKISNDIYLTNSAGYSWEKEYISTWCFNESGGEYNC